MESGDKKELELFLEDLRIDGVNLKNLSCSSKDHIKEKCDSCRFFESCPFPSKKADGNV